MIRAALLVLLAFLTVLKLAIATKNNEKSRFVADGQRRARSAEIDQVRTEVRERYAEALAKAGFWARFWLRLRMRREIERRMKELAPDDALYMKRN